MSSHQLIVHPLVLRRAEVVALEDLGPRMRRVRLGGPEVAAFHRDGMDFPAFSAPGFDDHVKIILAEGGPVETALPRQLPDGIEWTAAAHRITRDYTPRRVDPVTGEFDLEFVLHGSGPAAVWARSAQIGDLLAVVGPKSSLVLPEDIETMVVIGDESALPAVGRFFEERPTAAPVQAVLFTVDDSARQPLAERAGDRVHWIPMATPESEYVSHAVQEALPKELFAPAADEQPGRVFLWVAGESRSLLGLRRLARRTWRIPRELLSITGYWHIRQESADGDEHAPGHAVVPESTVTPGSAVGSEAPAGAPALPPSPLGWFAVRAGLQLGLFDALDEEPGDITDLAHRCGTDPLRLQPLVTALQDLGLIRSATDAAADAADSSTPGSPSAHAPLLQLGEPAVTLLEDEHQREEFLGLEAEETLALQGLAAALRTPPEDPVRTPAWWHVHGSSFATSLQKDTEQGRMIREGLTDQAEGLMYLQHGLRRLLEPWDPRDLALSGPGASTLRQIITEHHPTHNTTAVPTRQTVQERAHAPIRVSVLQLSTFTEAEAEDYLRELGAFDAPAVLIDQVGLDELSTEASAQNLLALGRTGAPLRGLHEVDTLMRRSGRIVRTRVDLGWGMTAWVLEPRDDVPGTGCSP